MPSDLLLNYLDCFLLLDQLFSFYFRLPSLFQFQYVSMKFWRAPSFISCTFIWFIVRKEDLLLFHALIEFWYLINRFSLLNIVTNFLVFMVELVYAVGLMFTNWLDIGLPFQNKVIIKFSLSIINYIIHTGYHQILCLSSGAFRELIEFLIRLSDYTFLLSFMSNLWDISLQWFKFGTGLRPLHFLCTLRSLISFQLIFR